jgi:putative DNA primase/helicase
MLDTSKLIEVDKLAIRFQPPIRKITSDDYEGFAPSAVQDGVVLVCGSTLTPQPVAWVWEYWLAQGKLHVLAGAPGQGKTTIALAFMATITIGGRWPDGKRCEAGNVLIWSGEDDPADTLLPRLIAMGADRDRVYFVEGARVGGELVTFDPARDMNQLLRAIEQIGGISLLVVDPIVSAITGDSHKNTEVRRALQPLVDLAASCNCAILGISHFAKGGQGQDPTQRVVGSVAFSAVARVVLVAAKVKSEDGSDRRILARSKSNLGPDDGGFEYHIEQSEPLPGIQASSIAWGAAVAGSARELLTDPEDVTDNASEASDAAQLLTDELVADSWTNSETACKPLKDAGFTKKQIWAASKKLNVIRKKGGMKDGWYWRLPGVSEAAFRMKDAEDSAEGSEGSNNLNGESSESSRGLESLETVEFDEEAF